MRNSTTNYGEYYIDNRKLNSELWKMSEVIDIITYSSDNE